MRIEENLKKIKRKLAYLKEDEEIKI